MVINKNKKPEIVNVSSTDLEEIQLRISTNTLSDNDKKVITAILTTYQWLYNQLKTAKLGMRRLKNLFGFKTEKNPAHKPLTSGYANGEVNQESLLTELQTNNGGPPVKK